MYRLLEWAFAYDDGSGLPDAGAYAAELKNVTATADGKPRGLRVKKCVRNRGFSRIDL